VDRGWVAEICSQGQDCHGGPGEAFGECGGFLVVVEVGEEDVRPVGGEAFGEGWADAAGGPSDQGGVS
jgi:hypothetical protein